MGQNDIKKEQARELYIRGNHTQKSIAELYYVTEKTLGKWKEAGKWDEQINLQSVTKKQLLSDSYAQLAAVNEKIKAIGNVPTKELYDAKSILGKEIDRLSDSPLAVYTDVFTEFIDFLLRNHPKHTNEFGKLSMEFIESKR